MIVSVHQNQPAPDPADLACFLHAAVANEANIAIVAVDGSPKIVARSRSAGLSRTNKVSREKEISDRVLTLRQVIGSASADSDGSDLFAGVKLAADFVGKSGHIVIIDSGLTDTGVIDMTRPGTLSADAVKLAQSIRAELTALHLEDINVTMISFGYTSRPQLPLSPAQSDAVVNLWRQLFTTAGATVTVVPLPRTDDPPKTPFTTRPVPILRSSASVSPAR